ncbi:MAG: M48 family metallopeptidase [Oscillochloridaceae bacterium umkhey_bin13]
MNHLIQSQTNPTAAIELDFSRYITEQDEHFAARSTNGIPNYAFALDAQLRQKIAKVRPVRDLAKAITALNAPLAKQQHLFEGVAVGPNMYPRIHQMGEECARQLGIAAPQILIVQSQVLNAFAYATDDIEPVVVLHSRLVEVMEPNQLKFIIGHECGHIHNLHSVYNVAGEILANTATRTILDQTVKAGMAARLISTTQYGLVMQLLTGVVSEGLRLFFQNWSRCAEITCDRAGLICCGDLRDAQYALAKLKIAGLEQIEGFDIDVYVRQLGAVNQIERLNELFYSHPLIPRRIQALNIFAQCESLYAWRPELPMTQNQPLISRTEADQRCSELINVFTKDLN